MLDNINREPLNKPNDLAFDSAGNLLFTCPGESQQEPTGYAVVCIRDGTVKTFITDKYFSNGLAFSADGKTLVLADTYRHRLWKGIWNAERGEWTNAAIWATVEGPRGQADQMAWHSAMMATCT